MSEITHDENLMRYSLFQDGLEAYLTYTRPRAGHRHVTHTIVPGPLSGKGIGRRLVTRLMEDVIQCGETVSSDCWFASALIEKSTQWAMMQA